MQKYKIRNKPDIRETRLKSILDEKNIMQKQLAEMTGIKEYSINLICNGRRYDFRINTAKRICNALGLSMDEVFSD